MREVPNFIFGGISVVWNNDQMDMVSKVDRNLPFQHRAISDVIVQQWFVGRHLENLKEREVRTRFSTVPDNFIRLVCNAIECALQTTFLLSQLNSPTRSTLQSGRH